MVIRQSLAFVVAALLTVPAHAAWTIVAVDPATMEVGSAGAACNPTAMDVVKIIPGKGALAVPASTTSAAKDKIIAMVNAGQTAPGIIKTVSDVSPDVDVESEQYGIAV